MSKRITTHGTFERIDAWRYGPLMEALNINMVKNIGPRLVHDGAVTLHEPEHGGVQLNYVAGGKEYGAVIHKTTDDVFICGYCSSDDKPIAWCTHIHHALTSRFDYTLFQENGRFIIPVVPSEGIFCPVHVETVESERSRHMPTLRKVMVVMQNLETKDDDRIVIGYLRSDRFGNADIRNLFSDWVVGCMDDKRYFAETACTGQRHQEIADDAHLSEFGKRFYPAMYGMCPTCIKDYEKSENSAADDAPKF